MKIYFSSFLSMLCSVTAFATPTQPVVTGPIQLGSERLWDRIESTFVAKTSASVARKTRVSVFSIDAEGRAWRNDSADYTKVWTQPAGCSGTAACMGSYMPSGKRNTDWLGWNQILADARFDWTIKPVIVRDESGNAQLFLSQISPQRRVVAYVFNDASSTTTKVDVSPVLTQNVTNLSSALLGGRDNVTQTATLVSVHVNGVAFRLFERVGNANFTERRVAPSGSFQISEQPPRFQTHGIGNTYATYFYFSGGSWVALPFEHVLGGLPRVFESRQLDLLTATSSPQVLWQPGGYAHGIFVKNDRLHANLGLFAKQNFGLPAVSTQISDVPVRFFETFAHNSDVFVVSNHTDGTTKMFRFATELPRGEFQQVGELSLAASSDLRALDIVQLGTEIYATATINTGRVVWVNLIRAAADQMSRRFYLLHYAPPTMGLPYDSLLSFSNFGQAFWSVPQSFHQLYTTQPASRCHPAGFSPPIVCGKVFFEWNDYWGVPSSPGVWQTREMAIAAKTDSDPNTIWPLEWLKAFIGSVVLKSNFNDTQSVFHELMHEFDFDGIRGSLVPGASEFLADYNRIFSNRSRSPIATRNTGFITQYAFSNAAEDWADTASYYRFQGAWFRFLAELDTALGDNRLQQKYDLVKRVFRNREFSNFGTMSFGAGYLVPFVQMNHTSRSDFVPVASAHEASVRIRDGYAMNKLEGWVLARQIEGTEPLKLFANSSGNLAVAMSGSLERTLLNRGFFNTGTIVGYVYTMPRPGTKPLRFFIKNTSSLDVTSSADEDIQTRLRNSRYVENGIDGYVLENPVY